MAFGFTRRYSIVLGVSTVFFLAFSIYFALASYPLQPPLDGINSMGLAQLVIFPSAMGGGLLFALLYWREHLRTHESVRWVLVYPMGAVLGVSVPVMYLLVSPRFGGGVRGWYKLAVIIGVICGVIAEVVRWRHDER